MSQEQDSTTDDDGAQPRVIGPSAALAVVVGSMLGIGIFLTPPQVATHLPSAAGYLAAWLVGGLIAFCGAVAYAELGTRFPRAGGDYVFLSEAFGESISFAAGWVLFVGVFTGSVATMAVPLAQYQLPVLLAPLVEFDPGRLLWALGPVEVTAARAVGIGLVAALTVLNVLGTRLSARTQIALTAVPVVLLAAGALVVFATADSASMSAAASAQASPVVGFGRAVLAVYFAYAGWNAVAYVGGELERPGQTIPKALLGGTALITALYLLLAGCFLYVLGLEGVQQSVESGTATARAVGGEGTAYAVTTLIAVALLGSLNATVLAGGRVGWAMARTGAMVAAMDRLNERFATPARALWLQALLAIVLVVTGTFEILLELTSIAMFVMSSLTIIALFVVRRRDGPDAPYQATWYPWPPLLFLTISVVVIGASVYRAVAGDDGITLESTYPLLGVAIFIAAWLGHRLWRRRR